MSKRCYRCKVEYESGGYYNGNGYCMTCYVRAMQDDERKRRDTARTAERRELEMKKQKSEILLRDRQAREQKLREERARETARSELLQRARREKIAGAKPKRQGWNIGAQPQQPAFAPPLQVGFALKRTAVAQKKVSAELYLPSHAPGSSSEKPDEAVKEEKPVEAKQELVLEASGLPVSLSVGQKGVSILLHAKNNSDKAISVSFFVSVVDSEGKQLAAKVEPSGAMLEAGGEASAEASFDLKETTSRGPLSVSCYISENAFYLDRKSAKSNTVALTSQVKLPLKLEYRKASAAFEKQGDGTDALCLTFDNLGESGGILSTKSSATYGKGKAMERAPLSAKKKVKGLEKNVVLRFSPAKEVGFERLEIELIGVDSNGKPYGEKRVAGNRKE